MDTSYSLEDHCVSYEHIGRTDVFIFNSLIDVYYIKLLEQQLQFTL